MVLGSILMWVGLPLGLLYVASTTVESSQPRMGPYMLVLLGLPVGLFVIGRWLGSLDRAYARAIGSSPTRRQAPWMRSLRGERAEQRQWQVLDVVMLWSVATALGAMGVWFLLFGDHSLSLAG
jgi:hypothetical protein